MTTRNFFTFLLVLLFAATLFGQNQSKPNDGTVGARLFPPNAVSDWSIGFYAGTTENHLEIDVSYATDMKYSDADGVLYGLFGEYHLTGWFSFRGEMDFVQKNYRMDRSHKYLYFVYTEATNNYLSVPVMAVLSLGRSFRVSGFVGAYAGYWLSGHREGQSLSVSYLISGNMDDTYFSDGYSFNKQRDNRFDAGLVYGFGIRYAIARKLDLTAEMRYLYGLTDMQKAYMTDLNPRYNTTKTLQIGVGYWF